MVSPRRSTAATKPPGRHGPVSRGRIHTRDGTAASPWPRRGPVRAISESGDPLSGYWDLTRLVAVKSGGITSRRRGLLDPLDLQLGWRTRTYGVPGATPPAVGLEGVGLDLVNLRRRLHVFCAAFYEYFQAPWVSVRLGHEMNDGDSQTLGGP